MHDISNEILECQSCSFLYKKSRWYTTKLQKICPYNLWAYHTLDATSLPFRYLKNNGLYLSNVSQIQVSISPVSKAWLLGYYSSFLDIPRGSEAWLQRDEHNRHFVPSLKNLASLQFCYKTTVEIEGRPVYAWFINFQNYSHAWITFHNANLKKSVWNIQQDVLFW